VPRSDDGQRTTGGRATWGYTRTVTSLRNRLTGVAVVIVLSGSPAMLSACMAFCLQDELAPSHEHGASVGHVTHSSSTVQTDGAAHAHHGSLVSNGSDATTAMSVASHSSSKVLLSIVGTNCCPEAQTVLLAGRGVERTDAASLGATSTVSKVASFYPTPPVLGASPPGSPGSPPSPTTAALVLRI
jgi:uncharacterized Zn-binding protein involved in type VI secretion